MAQVEFIDLAEEITEDVRGFSSYPLRGRVTAAGELPAAFHLVSIAPGQARGHHLHPGRLEWLYLFHGAGRFIWEDTAGTRQERLISGHRTIIRIPPGVAHAIVNPGPEPVYLLAWREGETPPGAAETVPAPL